MIPASEQSLPERLREIADDVDCWHGRGEQHGVDLRRCADEIEHQQAELKAHREALSRLITTVNPTGYEDGTKAEEAFEMALKCVITDREAEAELERLRGEREQDTARMRQLLLDQPWHRKTEIILGYMPPYPNADTRPTVQIRYNDGSEHPPFLRYSAGPKQGFFWDIYGEDFQNESLALLALHKAPAPVNVGPITFSIKLPPLESPDAARDAAREQGGGDAT